MSTDAFELLRSQIAEPIVLIDIGARGGVMEFYSQFGEKAKVFCFEADIEEAARLAGENSVPTIEYVPIALGANSNDLTIHMTEGPACSSVYRPIEALYERYPALRPMRPVRSISCQSTTLDTFCQERAIPKVHGLKLDTQGSELDILKGAENVLRTCCFIAVELEFNTLYEGQPLFCDVDRHLRERGFSLWRLNNLAHYSTGVVESAQHHLLVSSEPGCYEILPVDNGQLFWADALYIKADAAPTSSSQLPFDDAIAGAALASQWRLWDVALEMVRKSGAIDLFAELSALLQRGSRIPMYSRQIEAIRQSNDSITKQNSSIAKENDSLMKEIDALKTAIAKLKRERQRLRYQAVDQAARIARKVPVLRRAVWFAAAAIVRLATVVRSGFTAKRGG